jgi:hypothetical protein
VEVPFIRLAALCGIAEEDDNGGIDDGNNIVE